MNDYIFNRIEQKYLLTRAEYDSLIKDIENKIDKDEYFISNISNVYYDDENKDLIINSIEKDKYKHKVRLRAYDTPNLESDVFLEIKSKYKDIVNKRRIKIKLKDFYNYYDELLSNSNNEKNIKNNNAINNEISNKNIINKNKEQIEKEIDYLFKFYKLKPFYFVSYLRNSYKGKEENDLRITFDFSLKSRNYDLNIEKGNYGDLYFKEEEKIIMEIKSLNAMPMWLARCLSNNKIFPISISKIGRVYLKNMEELTL